MKTTLILSRKYKVTFSEKHFGRFLLRSNFVIVLLAAQVNRKIESDIEFSRCRDQVTKSTGILVEITQKNTWRASLEPSEDIWMVFMETVKDFQVKNRLASFCFVNIIHHSV